MSTPTEIPDAAEFKMSRRVDIRFVDVDAMGHVNNAHYATYFEERFSSSALRIFCGVIGSSYIRTPIAS
jgi:acyl-ACP thioesterase